MTALLKRTNFNREVMHFFFSHTFLPIVIKNWNRSRIYNLENAKEKLFGQFIWNEILQYHAWRNRQSFGISFKTKTNMKRSNVCCTMFFLYTRKKIAFLLLCFFESAKYSGVENCTNVLFIPWIQPHKSIIYNVFFSLYRFSKTRSILIYINAHRRVEKKIDILKPSNNNNSKAVLQN